MTSLVRVVLLALAFAAAPGFAAELPSATDLRADAVLAKRENRPILVFFTATSCPYCHIVQEDYLKPMFNRGEYTDKLLFRVVNVESDATMRDFQGKKLTQADFASRHGAALTPQVKLFDSQGNELVPGLVGLITRDFYAGFLEDAIDSAVSKLRQKPAV